MDASARCPQLALRVGITGHRWRDPHHDALDVRLDPAREGAVRDAIRTILVRIRETSQRVLRDQADVFAAAPPILSLVSALAEGADEIAAAMALESEVGYALDVVAPYDFAAHAARCAPGTPLRAIWEQARARLVLDGALLADLPEHRTVEARHEATLIEVNRRLVWNSDLVIAVWDGKPARGAAGTANVIDRARIDGLPVLCIHAGAPERITVFDGEAARVGDITLLGAGSVLASDDTLASIDAIVARLLMPPARGASSSAHGHAADDDESSRSALLEYQHEREPGWIVRSIAARIYKVALRVLTLGTTNASLRLIPPDVSTGWLPWSQLRSGAASGIDAGRTAVIDGAFLRADYFATAFGARHRSTFTVILFGAPLAVVSAWFGSQASTEWRPWFAGAELLLLSILMLFYRRSRTLRFHERMLDYRLLAERLRHLGFLWPLGRSSPVVRVPVHAMLSDPRPAWANWWYRAVTRQLGLVNVTYTPEVVEALKTQVREELIEAQIEYNEAENERAENTEHWLHRWTSLVLALALVAAAMHFLDHLLDERLHIVIPHAVLDALTSVGILGPAFGAAMHAFGSQAAFQEIALRTETSTQQLEVFMRRLDAIDVTATLASAALGTLTLELAEMLGDDLAGWHVDNRSRPVNPPG